MLSNVVLPLYAAYVLGEWLLTAPATPPRYRPG